MTTDPSFVGRPQSTKEISSEAEKFVFNTYIPLKQWVRAADTLYREGNVCRREGNLERAYLLLLRHSNLVFGDLKKHPEYKTKEGRLLVKPLTARLPLVFEQLESIKPHINNAYEEWHKLHGSRPGSQGGQHPADGAAVGWAPQVPSKFLDAGKHKELAVDLAQREFRRRDAARRSTRQAGISEEEEQGRRAGGLWDWDDGQARHDDDLITQMAATRRQLELNEETDAIDAAYVSNSRPETSPVVPSATYHYPKISKSTRVQYDPTAPVVRREPSAPPPSRPPKELMSLRYDSPPIRSGKEPILAYRTPPAPPRSSLSDLVIPPLPELPPKDERPAKKQRVTFKPAAKLENGEPLRPIFLPSGLRREFLSIAEPNTRRGLEMCGILCGTAVNNALFISCLLIPEQKCTSDTCETANEAAMLEYCMTEDLMIFGWIHTHPTQTCFMSSRDLHTQSGYQVMMPESIAIVCAPKFEPSFGIFRLTNPPGLPHILQCERTETFHQHFVDNLYTDAGPPAGHVYETDRMEFKVEDLRGKN